MSPREQQESSTVVVLSLAGLVLAVGMVVVADNPWVRLANVVLVAVFAFNAAKAARRGGR